jgi:release factor glutamine methyltransferase
MSRTGSVNRVARSPASRYDGESTILAIVEELTASLRLAGITDPRRGATDIVAALLEVPRSWPVMNRDANVDADVAGAARAAAQKLARGAPFAYAVESAPFRHLNLFVDERVLIPRPETEVLVGEILDRMQSLFGTAESWGTAIDIGTGSGAIALALAAEGLFSRVIATDASLDALEVARANSISTAAALVAEVEFRQGSLLSPVRGVKAAVLVSNPPYIAFSEMDALPASVRDWEPPIALFSGHDGMSATAGIVRDGWRNLVSGGLLALEVDERRASLVAEMIMRHGGYTDVGVMLDLAGRERFVLGVRRDAEFAETQRASGRDRRK